MIPWDTVCQPDLIGKTRLTILPIGDSATTKPNNKLNWLLEKLQLHGLLL
ncbi:MAG: hypothetical protein JRD89_02090 [Deltaproteobacteria bacterium]|nr:hypothetical protein [Deltaproteobacteria bacterium]